MKKILAITLTLVLLLSVIPMGLFTITASAATSGTTGDCTWSLDGTVLTISGNGKMGNYIRAYNDVLRKNTTNAPWGIDITEVIIENGVTAIGRYSFDACSSLTKVTLPESVTSIGEAAFANCESLASITIPKSVTSIENNVFAYCKSFTSIIIPDSVTKIEYSAFACCESLKSITIPDSVTKIGYSAFAGCKSLKSITIPDSVTSMENSVFSNCTSLESIALSKNITDIGYSSFDKCTSLTSVAIPNDVTSIGSHAFNECAELKSITLPQSIVKIGSYAFNSCKKISDVFYLGTPEQKENIDFSVSNGRFKNIITWHYVDDGDIAKHGYDNDCDPDCNGCGVTRTVKHTYDNGCDKDCNVCGEVRIPEHEFMDGCDPDCSGCGYVREVSGHKFKIVRCEKICEICGQNYPPQHTYDNSCDSVCNGCGLVRGVEHKYSNNCDTSCNLCKATRNAPHSYKSSVSKATLTKNGKITKTCSGCKKKVTTATIYYPKTFSLSKTSYTYNGKVQTPTVTVKDSKGKVIDSKYYTISYSSGRKNAGTYKVTVKFKGNYSGTKTLSYKINKIDISKCKVSISGTSYTYNGKVIKPSVKIINPYGSTLKNGTNYTVTYSSGCKNPGTYKVTVKMKGNYTGSKTFTYKINKIDISKCKVTLSGTSYTYNGKVIKPSVKIINPYGSTLKNGTNYTVTYSSGCKNPGTYKVTIKMKGNYTGSKTYTYKINKIDISKCKVSISGTTYTYDGKVKTPTITVKTASGTTLKKDTHYTVSYAAGRKDVGAYTVKVTMKGNYTGSKTFTVTINPQKTEITNLTANSDSIDVTIAKKDTHITGYEIEYSTNADFSNSQTKIITGCETTKVTISGLSQNTAYYVRVRTYTLVGDVKFYSGWSDVKSATTEGFGIDNNDGWILGWH